MFLKIVLKFNSGPESLVSGSLSLPPSGYYFLLAIPNMKNRYYF